MPEIKLGNKIESDYGNRYSGYIESESGQIPITWREPVNHEGADVAYVLATGWLGAKNSMRYPSIEAVKAGHIAVAFDYTNTGVKNPIQSNTENMVSVIDALPADLRKRAIGLSMGGRVLTHALASTQSSIESATAVASAGYIKHEVSVHEALMHLVAAYPESAGLFLRHPIHAVHVGSTALSNCVRRNAAVVSEMRELINGKVHHLVDEIKKKPNAPYLRFLYGESDELLPAEAQSEGVEGLKFDEVIAYKGGHLTLVADNKLSRHIIELDDQIPYNTPIPDPGDLKLAA